MNPINRSTATFISRFLNHDFDIPLLGLLTLTGFMVLKNQNPFWIVVSVLLALLTCHNPLKLLIAILLSLIGFIIMQLTIGHEIKSIVKQRFLVEKLLSKGFVIEFENTKVFVYSSLQVRQGDTVFISGIISPTTHYWKDYLSQNNIFAFIKPSNLDIIARSTSVRSLFQEYIMTGGDYYATYAPLMILGLKVEQVKSIYDMAIKINVIHLFVISGFHISLLHLIFCKILIVLRLPKTAALVLSLALIIFYLYLLNFPTPALRASLFITAALINRIYLKSRFKNINILTGVMVIMFLYQPYHISSMSFVMTFIATFAILLTNEIKFKNQFRRYISVITITYFSTWPLIVQVNNFIAPLGIIYGTILTPVFAIMYVLSIFFFPLKEAMNNLYWCLNWIIKSFNAINFVIPFNLMTPLVVKIIYLFPPAYLIILKLWFLFMVKKNI